MATSTNRSPVAIYETVLAVRGALPFLSAHLERLRASAEDLGLPAPPPLAEVAASAGKLLLAEALDEDLARVNLDLTTDGMALRAEPVPAEIRCLGTAGIAASTHRVESGTGAHKFRHRPELDGVLRAARAQGAAEAILLDSERLVLEGVHSNVFLVIEGGLHTPPLDGRILPGITRARVLTLARELGIPASEEPCTASGLAAAEEVFVTSAIRLLVPVITLDGEAVGPGVPGRTARTLRARLEQSVGL